MKIVIISDVKGQTKSIIPYGLHLAKYLESEVDILHVVDPRIQQGVSSMYGDSQSITPGKKMSHQEIMQREKQEAEKELDDLLSREASRLNYPLKINVIVQEEEIGKGLQEADEKDSEAIFVINKEADHYMFESRKDITTVCKELNGITLLVPPGKEFMKIENVLLPADFEDQDFEGYPKVANFLNQFHPVINAIGEEGQREVPQANSWLSVVSGVLENSTVNWQMLTSENFEHDFIDFVGMVEPDLTVVFEKPQGLIDSIFKKELIVKVLDQTDTPVLFYSK
ncbi:MAG TPA: hypothetical protein VKA27_13935 [Sunxiuqinia sp.]|nr:hypothetical protein [Sunxiuqinia sp.]